jgi:formylglycine-generating enzyme required for sulfatase activity
MSFIEQWQASLPSSYEKYAKLATNMSEAINFTYGLLAAAVLEPASQSVKAFNADTIQAVKKIIDEEEKSNVVLGILQSWSYDSLEAARDLAAKADENPDLQPALDSLIEHFNASPAFFEALARAVLDQNQATGDVDRVAEQIKAGLVNVGGTTNIQTLTINLSWGDGSAEAAPAEAEPQEATFLPHEPITVEIPGGPFSMGVPQHPDAGENWQQHVVEMTTYKIGVYPVTNAQYAKFVEQYPNRRSRCTEPPWSDPDHPVVGVSWYDAVAYCDWLSEETGRNYRLPSEAEWEKAARGDQDDRLYPWGDELSPDHCNYNGDQTTPVGKYSQGQSPYGCYDMVGNVWEWTSTLWGDDWRKAAFKYPYEADDGREDPDEPASVYRVYRGGAFNDVGALLGCSVRNYYAPQFQAMDIGFRVVLDES